MLIGWIPNLAQWFRTRNMELQFWGYEVGNLLATIAGAGGFIVFGDSVLSVAVNDHFSTADKFSALTQHYPDATVTLGLGVIVLFAPLLRRYVEDISLVVRDFIDVGVLIFAILVLAYALSAETGWVSVAGASFVVGSALLRGSHSNPFLLKAGGVALSFGGICLALFGISVSYTSTGTSELLLGILTTMTGLSVFGAGLLTYEGGIFQTASYSVGLSREKSPGLVENYLHPTVGTVACCFTRYLDKPVQAVCSYIVKPSIFWINADIKNEKPFLTSMWARLPWRWLTATAAIATATPEGFTFALANIFWAIGDLAIGSEDWQKRSSEAVEAPAISAGA